MPRGKTVRPLAVLRESTDEQLLQLALAGSTEAFDEIVTRYRPRLLRYCAGLTRAERVDDAVQQTFMNAWLALGRGVAVRELRPWLFSIARNAAIDQLRLQRGDLVELSPELAGGCDPAVVSAARGEVDDVLRAVSELPERQRTALLETAVHGKSTERVAAQMGMSGGALRQLVHRARTSVRGMVASFLPGPAVSWFAQTGGDEGTRRLAVLLGGAGQGATAAALAATATVASVGAIGGGAITSVDDSSGKKSAEASTQSAGRTKTVATARAAAAPLTPTSLVRLPISTSAAALPSTAATAGAVDGEQAAPVRPTSPGTRRDRSAGSGGGVGDDAAETGDHRRFGPSHSSGSPGADSSGRDGRRRDPAPTTTTSSDRQAAQGPQALAASSRPGRDGSHGSGAAGGSRGSGATTRRGGAVSAPDGAGRGADQTLAPTPAAASPAPAASTTTPSAAAPPETDASGSDRYSTSPGGDGTAGSSSPMSSS